jgi:uncharacterized protein (UPF0332 family)
MSDDQSADLYWDKAIESLTGAESELAHGRYNNAVNRAYYAAFQAAVAVLLNEGVRTRDGRWAHTFVQSEFIGKLINRRHRYPSGLRDTLTTLQVLRHDADYRGGTIKRPEANRAVRRSREFVEALQRESEQR